MDSNSSKSNSSSRRAHTHRISYTSRFWVCGGSSITGGGMKCGKGRFFFTRPHKCSVCACKRVRVYYNIYIFTPPYIWLLSCHGQNARRRRVLSSFMLCPWSTSAPPQVVRRDQSQLILFNSASGTRYEQTRTMRRGGWVPEPLFFFFNFFCSQRTQLKTIFYEGGTGALMSRYTEFSWAWYQIDIHLVV